MHRKFSFVDKDCQTAHKDSGGTLRTSCRDMTTSYDACLLLSKHSRIQSTAYSTTGTTDTTISTTNYERSSVKNLSSNKERLSGSRQTSMKDVRYKPDKNDIEIKHSDLSRASGKRTENFSAVRITSKRRIKYQSNKDLSNEKFSDLNRASSRLLARATSNGSRQYLPVTKWQKSSALIAAYTQSDKHPAKLPAMNKKQNRSKSKRAIVAKDSREQKLTPTTMRPKSTDSRTRNIRTTHRLDDEIIDRFVN